MMLWWQLILAVKSIVAACKTAVCCIYSAIRIPSHIGSKTVVAAEPRPTSPSLRVLHLDAWLRLFSIAGTRCSCLACWMRGRSLQILDSTPQIRNQRTASSDQQSEEEMGSIQTEHLRSISAPLSDDLPGATTATVSEKLYS